MKKLNTDHITPVMEIPLKDYQKARAAGDCQDKVHNAILLRRKREQNEVDTQDRYQLIYVEGMQAFYGGLWTLDGFKKFLI